MSELDNIEFRRKRVLYRANHRGTQELDILIGGYVTAHLHTLDTVMLDRIETLLDEEETDLQAWIMGQRDIPEGTDVELLNLILQYKLEQVSH